MKKNHRKFKRALVQSHKDVLAVAEHFACMDDMTVKIGEVMIPAHYDPSCADSGDLKVKREGGDWQTIEVKGYPGVDWEKLSSYPLIIMERVEAYLVKQPRPRMYYAVAKGRQQAAALDVDKYGDQKVVRQIKHQITGDMVDCYLVPNECWKKISL